MKKFLLPIVSIIFLGLFLSLSAGDSVTIQKLDNGPGRYCFFNKNEKLWDYVWLDKDERYVIFILKSVYSPRESGLNLANPPELKIIEKVEVEAKVKNN